MGLDYLCRSAVLYACDTGCCSGRRSGADRRRDCVCGNLLWRGYSRKICSRKELRGAISQAGREWALRRDQAAALEGLNAARKSGDIEEGSLAMGQDAGLIRDIPPAAEVVTRTAAEAEEILRKRLPQLIAGN
jgi:hypothetical protein